MKTLVIIEITFVLCCICAYALDVRALDLMNAYEAALRNDPVFRAAIKENEASQANFTVGRAGLLPQISGSGTQMSNESRITGPYPTLGSPTIPNFKSFSPLLFLYGSPYKNTSRYKRRW